ncbi:hypothetical protein BV898_16499 [Hypsibius exemplaris]|uniref:Peptidase M12B domain-containing protein n=1 Tax=Hypsibius exemplaris TaxID=2072580 RepID=A0A9X6RLW3_HYPEX|nr:hypothetical protein BV898_16499 [Hypsibius exemplaris]
MRSACSCTGTVFVGSPAHFLLPFSVLLLEIIAAPTHGTPFYDLHKYMSPADLQYHFGISAQSEVPDYDLFAPFYHAAYRSFPRLASTTPHFIHPSELQFDIRIFEQNYTVSARRNDRLTTPDFRCVFYGDTFHQQRILYPERSTTNRHYLADVRPYDVYPVQHGRAAFSTSSSAGISGVFRGLDQYYRVRPVKRDVLEKYAASFDVSGEEVHLHIVYPLLPEREERLARVARDISGQQTATVRAEFPHEEYEFQRGSPPGRYGPPPGQHRGPPVHHGPPPQHRGRDRLPRLLSTIPLVHPFRPIRITCTPTPLRPQHHPPRLPSPPLQHHPTRPPPPPPQHHPPRPPSPPPPPHRPREEPRKDDRKSAALRSNEVKPSLSNHREGPPPPPPPTPLMTTTHKPTTKPTTTTTTTTPKPIPIDPNSIQATIIMGVVADYGLYFALASSGLTPQKQLFYILAFYNEVQAFYREPSLMQKARVTFSIKQIGFMDQPTNDLGADAHATTYLNNICAGPYNMPEYDHLQALTMLDMFETVSKRRTARSSSREEFFNVIPKPPRRQDMQAWKPASSAGLNIPEDKKVFAAVGLALLGSTCSKSHHCSVVEMNSFTASLSAAHELGHSLGMNHEGSNGCSAKDSLTSFLVPTQPMISAWTEYSRLPVLSKCAIQEIVGYLKGEGQCLLKPPPADVDKMLITHLQGSLTQPVTADLVCRLKAGPYLRQSQKWDQTSQFGAEKPHDPGICKSLRCYGKKNAASPDKLTGWVFGPAPVGTQCDQHASPLLPQQQQQNELHQYMDARDLAHHFGVTRPEQVPAYDLTTPTFHRAYEDFSHYASTRPNWVYPKKIDFDVDAFNRKYRVRAIRNDGLLAADQFDVTFYGATQADQVRTARPMDQPTVRRTADRLRTVRPTVGQLRRHYLATSRSVFDGPDGDDDDDGPNSAFSLSEEGVRGLIQGRGSLFRMVPLKRRFVRDYAASFDMKEEELDLATHIVFEVSAQEVPVGMTALKFDSSSEEKEKEKKKKKKRKPVVASIKLGVLVDFTVWDTMMRWGFRNENEQLYYIISFYNEVQLMYREKKLAKKLDLTVALQSIGFFTSPQNDLGSVQYAEQYLENVCAGPYNNIDSDQMQILTYLDIYDPSAKRIAAYTANDAEFELPRAFQYPWPLGPRQSKEYPPVKEQNRVYDTVGLAWIGSTCDKRKHCTIVEMNSPIASFSAAHEIGHSIGVNHEEEGKCPFNSKDPENSSFMSAVSWSANSWATLGKIPVLTKCTVNAFMDAIVTDGKCLVKPEADRTNPSVDFKLAFHGKDAPGKAFGFRFGPAVPGTSCAVDRQKVCYNFKCTDIHSIPQSALLA